MHRSVKKNKEPTKKLKTNVVASSGPHRED